MTFSLSLKTTLIIRFTMLAGLLVLAIASKARSHEPTPGPDGVAFASTAICPVEDR